MGQLDTNGSYETRELAWELQQEHPDRERVSFLIEGGAVLSDAMLIANLGEKDLLKRAELRPLQLHKRLPRPETSV